VYHLLLRYVLPSYKIIVLLFIIAYQSTAKKNKNKKTPIIEWHLDVQIHVIKLKAIRMRRLALDHQYSNIFEALKIFLTIIRNKVRLSFHLIL